MTRDRDNLEWIADRVRGTMLHRRYLEGGGSDNDFATDIGYVVEAVCELQGEKL